MKIKNLIDLLQGKEKGKKVPNSLFALNQKGIINSKRNAGWKPQPHQRIIKSQKIAGVGRDVWSSTLLLKQQEKKALEMQTISQDVEDALRCRRCHDSKPDV